MPIYDCFLKYSILCRLVVEVGELRASPHFAVVHLVDAGASTY